MPSGDGHGPLYQLVGERIARARHAAGISQEKLAKKVGVTRASIVNIESGRQRPPLCLIWRIATALELEPVRLIPLQSELAELDAPVQLDGMVVRYIQKVAADDPVTRRILTAFVQQATNRIEARDDAAE